MTDTHDRHGYPLQGFFVAHHRFMGPMFPREGTWGDILGGPVPNDEDVIEAILEAYKDEMFPPDRSDLRVWHIIPGKPAEDCTDWAIRTVIESIELKAEGF